MRTTLDIEDDVLAAARELARQQQVSAGQMISRLLREALTGIRPNATATREAAPRYLGGFRPFPALGAVVTNETIDQLRDQEGV